MTLPSSILTGTTCAAHLSARAYVEAVVRFEVALARAQSSFGLVPVEAADAIESAAREFVADVGAVAREGHAAGTPIVEILDQLGALVEERRAGARAFLHLGATSQDALDTATVLCLKPCVTRTLEELKAAKEAAFSLAAEHASIPMLARTLMQAAGITTFGFKAAQWGDALARCERRLDQAAEEALCLQLAGPVGSGLTLGDRWPELQEAVAERLGINVPSCASWQALRDSWTNLLLQLAVATSVAAKIAVDLALLCQSEVGEAYEPSSVKGVSSAMPHKRNPVLCMRIRACSRIVQGLSASLLSTMEVEHERALGSWQAELALAPSLVAYSLSASQSVAALLTGVRFDAERARQNIDRAGPSGSATFDLDSAIEAAARATRRVLSQRGARR